jgi:hypothetical protein
VPLQPSSYLELRFLVAVKLEENGRVTFLKETMSLERRYNIDAFPMLKSTANTYNNGKSRIN